MLKTALQLETEKTIFIGKIYSTHHKNESELIPHSYCESLEKEALKEIHDRNVSPKNVTLRVDNRVFGKAIHVLILAKTEKEAKMELDKIPRPKQSPTFFLF